MRRLDVAVVSVIVATTGLSWSLSLSQDREQLRAESWAAGQAWSHAVAADPPGCREESVRLLGPVDAAAWRAGCHQVAVNAERAVFPAPPAPAAGGVHTPIGYGDFRGDEESTAGSNG